MRAAEPKIGAILEGRYQLLSELGRGGMGAVFLGLDFQTGREVAIKMGLPGLDEAGRARLRREALALAQIEHPGVVPVHDAKLEGEWPFFVMPRLAGEDFQSWIDREGRCEDP